MIEEKKRQGKQINSNVPNAVKGVMKKKSNETEEFQNRKGLRKMYKDENVTLNKERNVLKIMFLGFSE